MVAYWRTCLNGLCKMIPQDVPLCIRFLCGLMAVSSVARSDAAQQTAPATPASIGFLEVDGGKLAINFIETNQASEPQEEMRSRGD
jgi:hypothetical protein